MTTLPKRAYADPLEVVMELEAVTCKGCQYEFVVFDRRACGRGREHGSRCSEFCEREENMQKQAQQATAAPMPFHELSPYQKCMTIWSRWQRLSDRQHSDGDAEPQDTKDFMRQGEAVNTMIEDLKRYQWWAVMKSRGFCTVWQFPTLDLAATLEEVEEILTPKMRNHIATRRYFD